MIGKERGPPRGCEPETGLTFHGQTAARRAYRRARSQVRASLPVPFRAACRRCQAPFLLATQTIAAMVAKRCAMLHVAREKQLRRKYPSAGCPSQSWRRPVLKHSVVNRQNASTRRGQRVGRTIHPRLGSELEGVDFQMPTQSRGRLDGVKLGDPVAKKALQRTP